MSEILGSDGEWVAGLRDGHRTLARAQYAEVEMLTGWFRRGCAAEYRRRGRLLHSPNEGAAAVMEAAAVLRMTESAVDKAIVLGLVLDDLPCTRAAFAAGDLDVDRVRVIAEVTGPVNPAVRAELDRRLSEQGLGCGPTALRVTGRRWAVKLDPESASERRKRSVADRDVRARAVGDGMAWLEGWLPVETAQAVTARLSSMAQTQVCAGDPRTFPQRRADALLALVDGTGRLVCGCGHGADCPQAGVPVEPAGGASIQVGVSLETLLGLRDWPGYLHGAGAIDPDTARLLARDGRWEWIIAAIDAAAAATEAGASEERVEAAETDATTGNQNPAEHADTNDTGDTAVPGDTGADAMPGDTADVADADDIAASDEAETGTDTVVAAEAPTPTPAAPDDAAEPEDDTVVSEDAADASVHAVEAPTPLRARSGATARRAVDAACRAAGNDWDDPNSPAALRYTWPAGLADWIRARDGSCRWPGCTIPAKRCDIDHTLRFDHADPARGGRTIRSNGACLCRRHHRCKTDGENGVNGWQVRQYAAGRLEFTTPTGEVIVTEPLGAPDLWPTPDLHLPTPPVQDGYISDPTIFDNPPYYSELEEWLDYLLESHPPPRPLAVIPATRIPVLDLDEPPPF